MESLWRVELLGGLRARMGTQTITRFRTQKAAALLARLALYPTRTHAREELVELFWPDAEPEAARNNFKQLLATLRRQLEPPDVPTGGVLIADRLHVRLNTDAVKTDVAEFEAACLAGQRAPNPAMQAAHLEQAVQLYGGELLPGFYDDWILNERTRLLDACLTALMSLAQALSQAGEPDRALDYAHRAVGLDPLHEDGCSLLMRLHVTLGQPAAALRHFRKYEQMLQEQMGDAPSPALRQLSTDLLRLPRREERTEKADKETRRQGEGETKKAEDRTPNTEHRTPEHPTPTFTPRLPVQFTSFFGREGELEQLRTLLRPQEEAAFAEDEPFAPAARLITLTGMGGTGKTRLASEAARQMVEAYAGAVWFVPLADIFDPALMPGAIVDALHLPRSADVPAGEQAAAFLSSQPSLLVLDNLEQIAEHAAPLVRQLLEQAPCLTVIVTSRHLLNVAGEREFAVAPLPIPVDGLRLMVDGEEGEEGDGLRLMVDGENASVPQSLNNTYQRSTLNAQRSTLNRQPSTLPSHLASPAVRLFVARAQAVMPDFQITPRNADAIATLCRRLEGIPLAIELAAARARVLTPTQMLTQLEKRLDFLVSRRHDGAERHRTLRAAIEWSYRLLSPELQQFFTRLSVFRGGWTLEAAEVICEEPLALDCLEQLRERSLVLTEADGDHIRFRMLESLREYAEELRYQMLKPLQDVAQENLSPSDRAIGPRRHAEFFLQLAESAQEPLRGAEAPLWYHRLDADIDNLRAALSWALANDASEIAWRMEGALGVFWRTRGHFAEGRDWVTRTCALGPLPLSAWCANALNSAGTLCLAQGDLEEARVLYEQSLAIRRALGDRKGIANSLNNLALIAREQSDFARCIALNEESLTTRRELGDKHGIAGSLNNLGHLYDHLGEAAKSRFYLEESLGLYRELGSAYGTALCLINLGKLAYQVQDLARARALFEECVEIRQTLGDRHGLTTARGNLALVLSDQGEKARALEILAQTLAQARDMGAKRLIGTTLNNLAMVHREMGDMARARDFQEQALARRRELGDPYEIVISLMNRGLLAACESDVPTARACYRECVGLVRDSPQRHLQARLLERFAGLDCEAQPLSSARLLGAAFALRGETTPIAPEDVSYYQNELASCRAMLAPTAFEAAWKEGSQWTAAHALDFALTLP